MSFRANLGAFLRRTLSTSLRSDFLRRLEKGSVSPPAFTLTMIHFAKWAVLLSVGGLFGADSLAQWVSDQSVSERVAEDTVVHLVNTVLFFDRLFSRPTTETSRDYLARVANPSSKFYRDYLAYKDGRISRSELAGRLPHIAMVGDSLSKHFYISSPASMLWRARTERQRNWFLDTDPSPVSVESLFEKMDEVTPLVATEYSSAGAMVAPGRATEPLVRRLAQTQNLRRQIRRLTHAKRFPDVVLFWIGHNNTDWVSRLTDAERKDPSRSLRRLAQEFGTSYENDLEVLIERAGKEEHRVALIVFGLADFQTFFEMRRKAAATHARDAAHYPYYEATCRYFEALQRANQENTIQLGLMMNEELKKMVARLRRSRPGHPNVRLEYSDALWRIDLSDLRTFNSLDAWHPSVIGHNVLAKKAFSAIAPSLAFVDIHPKSRCTARDQVARVKAR